MLWHSHFIRDIYFSFDFSKREAKYIKGIFKLISRSLAKINYLIYYVPPTFCCTWGPPIFSWVVVAKTLLVYIVFTYWFFFLFCYIFLPWRFKCIFDFWVLISLWYLASYYNTYKSCYFRPLICYLNILSSLHHPQPF